MRLRELVLRHVKSFGEAAGPLVFQDGVNFLSGRNGAGKSTVIEAIGYALYDVQPYSKELFVRRGARTGVVSVLIEDRGETFRVERKFGGSNSWIVYDAAGLARHERADDVVRFLCERLHVSDRQQLRNVFARIIGVEQGCYTAVFQLQPRERQEILDGIIAVDRFRKAADAHNDLRTRRLPEETQRVVRELAVVDSWLQEHRDDAARHRELEAAMAVAAQRIAALAHELETGAAQVQQHVCAQQALDLALQAEALARTQVEEAGRAEQVAAAELAAARVALQRHAATAVGARAWQEADTSCKELEERALRQREALAACQRIEQAHALAAQRRTDLEQRLAAVAAEHAALVAARAERLAAVEVAQQTFARAQAVARRGREDAVRRMRLAAELEALAEQQQAVAGMLCPFLRESCDRIRPEVFAIRRAPLEQQLAGLAGGADHEETLGVARDAATKAIAARDEVFRAELAKKHEVQGVREQLAAAVQACGECEPALAKARAELARDAEVDRLLAEARVRRRAHEPDQREHLASEQIAAQVPGRAATLAAATNRLRAAQADLAACTQAVTQARAACDPQAAARAQARQLALVREHASATTAQQASSRQLAELAAQLEAAATQRTRAAELQRELARWRAIAQVATDVWQVLRDVGPQISLRLMQTIGARANRIFALLHGGAGSLIWGEDYEVRLRTPQGELPFKNLSGGEQMAAALAIQMAMARDFAQSAFCIFDEPTVHLDAARKERLCLAIREARKEGGFTQVFVVSHDECFAPFVDHEIVLRNTGEAGTVVGGA